MLLYNKIFFILVILANSTKSQKLNAFLPFLQTPKNEERPTFHKKITISASTYFKALIDMSSEVTASESIASVIPPIPTVTATGEAAVLDNEQQQQQHGAEEEHEHEHEHDDEEAEEEDGDDDFHAGAAELGVDQIESACTFHLVRYFGDYLPPLT